MALRANEPLFPEERREVRSELGKLMRISRIARSGALYDASAAAQNFEDFNRDFGRGPELFRMYDRR